MAPRLLSAFRRLARIEQVFVILLPCYIAAVLLAPRSVLTLLLAMAVYVLGAWVALRWVRRGSRKFIWRLRNRLLVAYVFIAVVPIILILLLVGIGAWMLTGQIAVYLVTTELERRAATLMDPAQGLASTSGADRLVRARWVAPYYRSRFPGFEMLMRGPGGEWRYPEGASVAPPPAGWKNASGLVSKGGSLFLWAHAIGQSGEVLMMVPMGPGALWQIVPNLGDLALVPAEELDAARGKPHTRITIPARQARGRQPGHVPPPKNWFDREVTFIALVPVAYWETPGLFLDSAIVVDTRYSAVLRTIFGQKMEFAEGYTIASLASIVFVLIAGVFLVFELASLVIGVTFTRTITGAVHNLYQGTERVREGDFSHRIEVRGNDQLAELGHSFNRMTENLERLVEVAKEKERLQSELEIAREVQDQLYPKNVPVSNTLRLAALCRPARMVSGDYYDYLNLEEPNLALAIGDVAGKGISAALLMATVQSTMRTQLRAGRELSAAAGNGPKARAISTASLVSRLNQQLYAFTAPEKFATFYFAVYDETSGLLTYTNAGHLPPVLLRNGSVLRLEVTGTVVGAFPFAQYEEASVRLERGDLLVCFTDGLTEPENEYGEMFGEERLIDLVARDARREPEEIISSVMETVRQWTGSPELQDDMTMLLARRS